MCACLCGRALVRVCVLMQRLSGGCVWPALPSIVPYPVLPHEVEWGGWVISVNHNASQLSDTDAKHRTAAFFFLPHPMARLLEVEMGLRVGRIRM